MDRRELLALCSSGIAGVPGCVTSQGNPTRTATSEDSTTSPPDTGSALSVELNALQPAVVTLNVDYLQIHSETGSQYLYLDLAATAGSSPSLSDVAFRFDGDRYSPIPPDEQPPIFRSTGTGKSAYDGADDDDGEGWLLFELPETGDASESAFVWPGGAWRPDDRLRARLAAPLPTLSLEAWRVPETVSLNDRTTFGFTVRNEGGDAGRFVAGINASGWEPHRPVRRISRRVPPNESRSWEVPGEQIELVDEEMSDRVGDGEPDVEYELVWPGENRYRGVRIVDA